MFDTSLLQPFSVALVAENKPLDTTMILATPIEHLTMLDGQIKSNPVDVQSQGKDAQGQAYSVKGTMNNVVKADWLRGANTNRRTAPDVRRGERVQLYRYADTDKYYWVSLGLDDHLRKGETVIFTLSGTTDEKQDSTHPDNCWSLEASTHTGKVTFRNSKVNGELCSYTLQIDAKTGIVVLQDDTGNSFELDTKNVVMMMINSMGTYFHMEKKGITLYAPENIDLTADKSMSLTTKDLKIKASTAALNADTLDITAKTTITGDTTIKGTTTLTGNVNSNGVMHVKQLISDQPIQAPNV